MNKVMFLVTGPITMENTNIPLMPSKELHLLDTDDPTATILSDKQIEDVKDFLKKVQREKWYKNNCNLVVQVYTLIKDDLVQVFPITMSDNQVRQLRRRATTTDSSHMKTKPSGVLKVYGPVIIPGTYFYASKEISSNHVSQQQYEDIRRFFHQNKKSQILDNGVHVQINAVKRELGDITHVMTMLLSYDLLFEIVATHIEANQEKTKLAGKILGKPTIKNRENLKN